MASPLNNNFLHPQQITLDVTSLDFGILHKETSLMIMQTLDELNTRLVINFREKKLVVHFYFNAWYQMRVPFAHIDQIFQLSRPGSSDTILLPLTSPPEFVRRIADVARTHDRNARTWNERAAWFRVTEIVRGPHKGKEKPVKLHNEDATIDIGRWTVYRLTLRNTPHNNQNLQSIRQILFDYNIKILPRESLETINRSEPELMNVIHPADHAAEISSLHYQLGTGTHLDFAVRYQLEVCLSHGYLNEHNMSEGFYTKLLEMEPDMARSLLETAADKKQRIYDPMQVFNLSPPRTPKLCVPRYCAVQRSVTITPTTMHFATPAIETSNRIVRAYREQEDRFLRVKFADEKGKGQMRSVDDDTYSEVYDRIKRALKHGIVLGDRRYEFLAYGNSQFREQGAYFYASQPWNTVEDMRKTMGELSTVKIIAKWASRLGQNFSTTRAINGTKVKIVKGADIERNGYCFTDGVGKISVFLGRMIASEFELPDSVAEMPSVFQFRLGGCKGVLAVDPSLPPREIMIRKSQAKFEARHDGLEVVRVSSFATATLNRQLILVLSTLGVKDETFINMLRAELSNLKLAMEDEDKALYLLKMTVDLNRTTLKLCSMILDGFMASSEPFTIAILQLWRAWTIKLLKEKARLSVSSGAFLLGCVDEVGVLRGHINSYQDKPELPYEERMKDLPEIFVQIDDPEHSGRYIVIQGVCLLARNPSLHPGDIRVVRAVDAPALHHLRNVVVTPQRGDRPVSNMCSGGDLDGDDYFVSWDPQLLPQEWNYPAMDYTGAESVRIDRDVNIDDVIDFFITYMKNDRLPMIASAHLVWSDISVRGVKDERCLELAHLHSDAVDFPKSGVPVHMDPRLRVRRWPHFMEKNHLPKDRIYHSTHILGQLYDEIERIDFQPQYTRPFDSRILEAYKLDEDTLASAAEIKKEYDAAMRRIMIQHDIGTEFEVWSSFVLQHNFEKKDYTFAEEIGQTMAALRDRFRKECIAKAGGRDYSKLGPFVAALYTVTAREVATALEVCGQKQTTNVPSQSANEDGRQGMPLISMPWIFYHELGKIATGDHIDLGDLEKIHPIVLKPRHKKRKSASFKDGQDDIEIEGSVAHRGEVLHLFDAGTPVQEAPEAVVDDAKEEKNGTNPLDREDHGGGRDMEHGVNGMTATADVKGGGSGVASGGDTESDEDAVVMTPTSLEFPAAYEDEGVEVVTLGEENGPLGLIGNFS